MYKKFTLYIAFPFIPIITYFLFQDNFTFYHFIVLYLIAFAINGVFMKVVGEKLFTYKKNKK